MNWYQITKVAKVSTEELNEKLKNIIKSSSFFLHMFKEYGVPLDRLDELTFNVKKMNGRNAQSDAATITLNSKLFQNDDFFEEGIHFVVHEMSHWLTRQKEHDFYFADPEEIAAFSLGMAYEIIRGKDINQIYSVFFPIIRDHFNNDEQARELFAILFAKAKVKVEEYSRE